MQNLNSLKNDLKQNGFKILSFNECDNEIKNDLQKYHCEIALQNESLARIWYFTNERKMLNYFNNSKQLNCQKSFVKIQ